MQSYFRASDVDSDNRTKLVYMSPRVVLEDLYFNPLKYKYIYDDSVRTSQKTFSLRPFGECCVGKSLAVCCDTKTEYVNTLCGRTAEI
jgi:hypothetical protein